MLLNFQLVISTPVPSTCCKGHIKADVDKLYTTIFQFPDEGHLILLESHLHKWFGCQVTGVSKVNSKNVCQKGMISREKGASSWIWTADFLFARTTWTLSAVVFKGMLLKFSLHLRIQLTLQSKRKHTWTCGKKLGVGRWWALCVRHLLSRNRQSQVSYRRDRRTDGFSALYI